MSKNDDLVRRLRERATTLDKLYSHIDAKHMRDAADAIERGAAQRVTDEMVVDAAGRLIMALPSHAVDAVNSSDILFLDVAREVLGDALTSAPPAPAPDAGEVEGAVRETLREYRQTEVADEDGNGYPLVDALTLRGKGIDMGEREIDNIVSELMYAISPFIAAPSPTPQPPAVEAEAVERDIFEVANQLEGYVDESTPEPLARFLLREGREAAKLAYALKAKTDEIERLRRERDEWKNSAFLSDCEAQSGQLEEMTRRAEAAEASNKALREGLERAKHTLEIYGWDDRGNRHPAEDGGLAREAMCEIDALLSETGGE